MDNLFGRKWYLEVIDKNNNIILECGNSSFTEPESIQIKFEVSQAFYSAFWDATVEIFNLNFATNNVVLKEGQWVVLYAGYQNGQYGKIFKGKMFQPMWDRDNVVDYRTILHCIVGKLELANSFVAANVKELTTQKNLILQMAANCYFNSGVPLPIESLSDSLNGGGLPRGQVLFGNPRNVLNDIADANNLQWFMSEDGINVGNATANIPKGQALEIAPPPKGSIIGTPQQVENGIAVRTLLDSRITIENPPIQIFINNYLVRQAKWVIGEIPSRLDKDGYYNVIGIRHYGDTRGNEWYTDIIGRTPEIPFIIPGES
jgi:hypothetical protein